MKVEPYKCCTLSMTTRGMHGHLPPLLGGAPVICWPYLPPSCSEYDSGEPLEFSCASPKWEIAGLASDTRRRLRHLFSGISFPLQHYTSIYKTTHGYSDSDRHSSVFVQLVASCKPIRGCLVPPFFGGLHLDQCPIEAIDVFRYGRAEGQLPSVGSLSGPVSRLSCAVTSC